MAKTVIYAANQENNAQVLYGGEQNYGYSLFVAIYARCLFIASYAYCWFIPIYTHKCRLKLAQAFLRARQYCLRPKKEPPLRQLITYKAPNRYA